MSKKEETSRDNLEDFKNEIKELEKKRDEYLAGWQRERADFLNYKKDEAKRLEQFSEYKKEEFILKILPILDNFETAQEKISFSEPYSEEKTKKTIEGFLQIKNQIFNFLKNEGVEEIKSVEEKFDPNLHEATEEIAEVGPPQTQESGKIIQEVQKGYKINGKTLRPAKVKVAK